jgi:hypothetical protein
MGSELIGSSRHGTQKVWLLQGRMDTRRTQGIEGRQSAGGHACQGAVAFSLGNDHDPDCANPCRHGHSEEAPAGPKKAQIGT